jgi:hypothetical protein
MVSRNSNNISPPSHDYKRFFKEFFTENMKANKNTNGWAVSNHRRRKDKEPSNID